MILPQSNPNLLAKERLERVGVDAQTGMPYGIP
jgi:hypothetical protein